MKYEWDPKKAEINFKKHGVSFEMASTVFDDIHHISVVDHSSSIKEERWVTLGLSSDTRTIVVIHTYFNVIEGNEVIRIISARKATKQERRQYEEGI